MFFSLIFMINAQEGVIPSRFCYWSWCLMHSSCPQKKLWQTAMNYQSLTFCHWTLS